MAASARSSSDRDPRHDEPGDHTGAGAETALKAMIKRRQLNARGPEEPDAPTRPAGSAAADAQAPSSDD